MYLTVNNIAFYSYILGKESKLSLRYKALLNIICSFNVQTFSRWTDVTHVEKSANLLRPDTICISTRDHSHFFGMFLHRSNEAYELIRQLANLAMRKLIDDDSAPHRDLGFDLDLLKKRCKNVPKKASFLKRDLDARKKSEEFRLQFQMPNSEKLDGQVSYAKYLRETFVGVSYFTDRVLYVDTLQQKVQIRKIVPESKLCLLLAARRRPRVCHYSAL